MFALVSDQIACEEDEGESELDESGVSCDRIHVLLLEESVIQMNERTFSHCPNSRNVETLRCEERRSIPVYPIEQVEGPMTNESDQVADGDTFDLLSTLQDEKLRERCSDFEVD